MSESLCALAERFPIGSKHLYQGKAVTVISAHERENSSNRDSAAPTILDRVGSAYRVKADWASDPDAGTYIAVREARGTTNGIRPRSLKPLPTEIPALTPMTYTAEDMDQARRLAKAEAYERGVREGKRLAAVKLSRLSQELER